MPTACALISFYSPPNQQILIDSSHTLWACEYLGTLALQVVPVRCIDSVVSMQPLPPLPQEQPGRWFVVEKSGLDDAEITGDVEDD